MSQPRNYGVKLPCGHADAKYNLTKLGECITCRRVAGRRKMSTTPFYPCGHERTPENSVGTTDHLSCLTCKRERDVKRRQAKKSWLHCDHPRTPENTRMQGRKPRCKICETAYRDEYYGRRRAAHPHTGKILSGTATHFSCGCPRTSENTRKNGSPNGICRACNNRKAQEKRDRVRVEREARQARRQADSASVALYRTEKALAAERTQARQAAVIAEARRSYRAMLALQAEQGKGGRPRGKNTIQGVGKQVRDPLDLTPYLSDYFGRSA